MNHLAIYALYPTVRSVDANGIARDIEGNQVEIDVNAVDAWVDPDTYKYQRAKAYPSIPDQLDLIYHQGLDAWKAAIEAVKNQYPKGA